MSELYGVYHFKKELGLKCRMSTGYNWLKNSLMLGAYHLYYLFNNRYVTYHGHFACPETVLPVGALSFYSVHVGVRLVNRFTNS
jgi:hypothetical protein